MISLIIAVVTLIGIVISFLTELLSGRNRNKKLQKMREAQMSGGNPGRRCPKHGVVEDDYDNDFSMNSIKFEFF